VFRFFREVLDAFRNKARVVRFHTNAERMRSGAAGLGRPIETEALSSRRLHRLVRDRLSLTVLVCAPGGGCAADPLFL
jgi:hypothetical protein